MPTPHPLLAPAGERVAGVRRIAVLRSNAIGDFVVAVPALEALRAAYPDAEITYLGAALHPGWLAGRPGPWDRVEAVPAAPGAPGDEKFNQDTPELAGFLAEQRARRYDLAVQLHGGGGNSNPFACRLGARLTVGSRAAGAPGLDRCVPYVYYQHEVLRFLEVVGLVGAVPVTLEPRIAVVERDGREAAEVLAEADGSADDGSRFLVAVHAGATDPRRRWPPDRFAAVADALVERGARIALVGAPDDAALSEAVGTAMRHPALDLTGRLSLSGLTGLLARSALLVGNDSGPRHLAAAVGTATVGVYWCGNLINAGPLTRSRHRIGVSFQSICPDCGQDQGVRRCAHDPSFVLPVPVEEIRDEALELLATEVPSGLVL